jgi:hypothetical protein
MPCDGGMTHGGKCPARTVLAGAAVQAQHVVTAWASRRWIESSEVFGWMNSGEGLRCQAIPHWREGCGKAGRWWGSGSGPRRDIQRRQWSNGWLKRRRERWGTGWLKWHDQNGGTQWERGRAAVARPTLAMASGSQCPKLVKRDRRSLGKAVARSVVREGVQEGKLSHGGCLLGLKRQRVQWGKMTQALSMWRRKKKVGAGSGLSDDKWRGVPVPATCVGRCLPLAQQQQAHCYRWCGARVGVTCRGAWYMERHVGRPRKNRRAPEWGRPNLIFCPFLLTRLSLFCFKSDLP